MDFSGTLNEATLQRLQAEPAVLVTLVGGEGSLPRESGARMVVSAHRVMGSIGGGQLELKACRHACQLLLLGSTFVPEVQRWALGPSMGQCCGGVVELRFEALDATILTALLSECTRQRTPVAIFGGGHVGRALVHALEPLPFAVQWVDSRSDIFPSPLAAWVRAEHSDPVQQEVAGLSPGCLVLIMSFSHVEDLDIVAACLWRWRQQADLPFIGLMGSRSKWAVFQHRLLKRGFLPQEISRVHCPIGLPELRGKQPELIAASVAAQLLLVRQSLSADLAVGAS